ncbi:MAG TPA: GNAT family N-acetyltransferase [Mycobacteriales bacterium]|nr:GNAT family N-acetyltransferase [Mycobacteriales bacterium]
MIPEIRGAASIAEVESAASVLDLVLGDVPGWQITRAQHLATYLSTPGLLSIAFENDRIVGAVGCDGVGGVGAVAILKEYRGRGLGRRLLERAEGILRARGASAAGLGSLDGAVDFYLHCGYEPQLLVQFDPDVQDPEAVIRKLLGDVLAGRKVYRAEWQGNPQLWLQDRSVDWELKHRIEAVATGVIAQYTMSKPL